MADIFWRIPLESKEFVGPITPTNGGVPVDTWQVAVVELGTRPTVWADPDVDNAEKGVRVGPGTSYELQIGTYSVWVKLTIDVDDEPVVENVLFIAIV